MINLDRELLASRMTVDTGAALEPRQWPFGSPMCQTSVVSEDWVVKGCHIHVEGVELVIRPDHLGGFLFRGFFASTSDDDVDVAIRIALQKCVPDALVRKQWVRDIKRAMLLMLSYRGAMQSKANGRLAEFTFLLRAFENYEVEHGHARAVS